MLADITISIGLFSGISLVLSRYLIKYINVFPTFREEVLPAVSTIFSDIILWLYQIKKNHKLRHAGLGEGGFTNFVPLRDAEI